MTYWGYGVVGSILLGIPLIFVTPGSAPAILAVFLCVGYAILVNVGIWRAAGKYQGLRIWSFLAKAAIVAPLIGIGAAILIPAIASGNHAKDYRPADNQKAEEVYIAPSEIESAPAATLAPASPVPPSISSTAPSFAKPSQPYVSERDQYNIQVQADMKRIVDRAAADYPYLNTPAGSAVMERIIERRDLLIKEGVYPSIAMTRAVNAFAPAYAP